MSIVDLELDGPNTSRRLFDIYSISHITHGIILYWVLPSKHFIPLGLALEFAWEMFENTSYVIDKYRSNRKFQNYRGDSNINIVGDMFFTYLGLIFASKCSATTAFVALILMELILSPFNANFLYLSVGSLIKLN